MIVRGGQSLHLALLTLFNYLWRTETIPQAWLEAHTRLLHKGKKSKYEITDHRPISLIACIGKLFTMLWLPRLEQILDPHIVPHQMAGKEGASSEEAAWTLASIIDHHTKGQTRKQHMYTCFADTETAYDTVWRDGLYFLLHAYGVRGPLLRMVVAWHEGSSTQGKWHTVTSAKVLFNRGLRQGCIIAPILYKIFINPLISQAPDLPHPIPTLLQEAFETGLSNTDGVQIKWDGEVAQVAALLFLDDVAITAGGEEALQRQLDRYAKHCRRWRYDLHPDKFHILVYGARRPEKTWVIQTPDGPHTIPPENSAKYVGIHSQTSLACTKHIEHMHSAFARSTHLVNNVRQTMGADWALTVHNACQLSAGSFGNTNLWIGKEKLRAKLDGLTAEGNKLVSGAARNMRNDAALYEEDTLWMSNMALASQARLLLRLNRGKGVRPFQQLLLREQKAMYRAGAPRKANAFLENAAQTLQLSGLSNALDHQTKSKHALRKVMKKVITYLRGAQKQALKAALPLQPKTDTMGRCSVSLLSKVMPTEAPISGYAERRRIQQALGNHHAFRVLTSIRHGLVACAREKQKRNPTGSTICLSCSSTAAAVIDDAEHMIMECRRTQQIRDRVLSKVKLQARTQSLIQQAIHGKDDEQILLSTLGQTNRPGSKSHIALMRVAGPIWAREYKGLLI